MKSAFHPSAPRFPHIPPARGHYESFYVKLGRPTSARAVWIRYTIHKPPGGEPVASLWSTVFDSSGPPRAAKATFGRPGPQDDSFLSVGDAFIGNGHLVGAALDHSWDLRFTSTGPALAHLPSRWMYERRIPKTKLTSPHPEATFSGTVRVGDETIDVDGWPGMVGHNWGSQHAERWVWLHATFGPGTWLDVALGRVRFGPVTTPWIANGAVSVEGDRHVIGGLRHVSGTMVEETLTTCRFRILGPIPLTGVVERAPEQTVVWPYADPGGGIHHSTNCSIAAMSLDLGGSRFSTVHGAVYELGMRETNHGLQMQPFTDG